MTLNVWTDGYARIVLMWSVDIRENNKSQEKITGENQEANSVNWCIHKYTSIGKIRRPMNDCNM